jgi:starch phosphorylase
MRALRALGVRTTALHMNEGHGFLVAAERVRELRNERGLPLDEAERLARAELVFTTHTPVAAGSDYFAPALVQRQLGPYLEQVGLQVEDLLDLGRKRPGDAEEPLCTTYVGLRLAGRSVAVSRLHRRVSRQLWRDAWPGRPSSRVPIGSVTNGVHLPTWVAPEIAELLARHVAPDWADLDAGDAAWERALRIPDEELWTCHRALRRRLVGRAAHGAEGGPLDPDALTIGFSRRFAPYKRANLVLRDGERLARLTGDGARPIQFVFSGKAHPADLQGKAILHDIVDAARHRPRFAFVPDYGLEVARPLVQGADLWLNNPRRLLEASGTSGMKAGANGVLNMSVRDGWWDEAYRDDIGWAIPSAAELGGPEPDDEAEGEALYRLLEEHVVPCFYDRDERGIPARWVAMMRASIRWVAPMFAARRMVLQYHQDCYLRAAEDARRLGAMCGSRA